MLRGAICLWLSVILVTICSRGDAQIEGFPLEGQKDYDAAINGTRAEALELQELEQRHLREALVYMRQGKPKDAIRGCTLLLERFANHPKAFAILGMAARLIKEPLLPIPYFERALQLYPAYAMTHAQYGKYLSEVGRSDEGIKRLLRAVEISPQLQIAYTWLARVYIQQGQPDRARLILQRGREAEAIPVQGGVTGTDPVTEIFPSGEVGEEEARDETKSDYNTFGIGPAEGTTPTAENNKQIEAEQ